MKHNYLNYLLDYVAYEGYPERERYSFLLERLLDTPFFAAYGFLDENRAEDGLFIRNKFIKYHPHFVMMSECSVLEMMVALADRMETEIMASSDYINRTGEWFWGMLDCLGLLAFDNSNYYDEEVEEIIYNFLERQYSPDGVGGLFFVENGPDMRRISIWDQMQWFLNNYRKERE